MSRASSLSAIVAVGLLVGTSSAWAQAPRQGGAVDPSTFNTGGPGTTNSTRPTLAVPTTPSTKAASTPADQAKNTGFSNSTKPLFRRRSLIKKPAATTTPPATQ